MWADEVTLDVSTKQQTVTNDPITATASASQGDNLWKITKGASFTVSSTTATITGVSVTATVGDATKFISNVGTCNTNDKTISWTGSAESVTFTNNTSSSNDYKFTSIVVTYTTSGGDPEPEVTSLVLSPVALYMNPTKTSAITPTVTPNGSAISWNSNATSVATVSNGTVTGVAVGEATITATSGAKSATCLVHVVNNGTLSPISTATTFDFTQQATWPNGAVLNSNGSIVMNNLEIIPHSGTTSNPIRFESGHLTTGGEGNDSKRSLHFKLAQGKYNIVSKFSSASSDNRDLVIKIGSGEARIIGTTNGTYIDASIEDIELDAETEVYIYGGSNIRINNIVITPVSAVPTYTVTYNANGHGTAPVDATQYEENATVTVLDMANKFVDGNVFMRWNSSADGNGTNYNPNSKFTITNDINLYAIWKPEATITIEKSKIVVANGYTTKVNVTYVGDGIPSVEVQELENGADWTQCNVITLAWDNTKLTGSTKQIEVSLQANSLDPEKQYRVNFGHYGGTEYGFNSISKDLVIGQKGVISGIDNNVSLTVGTPVEYSTVSTNEHAALVAEVADPSIVTASVGSDFHTLTLTPNKEGTTTVKLNQAGSDEFNYVSADQVVVTVNVVAAPVESDLAWTIGLSSKTLKVGNTWTPSKGDAKDYTTSSGGAVTVAVVDGAGNPVTQYATVSGSKITAVAQNQGTVNETNLFVKLTQAAKNDYPEASITLPLLITRDEKTVSNLATWDLSKVVGANDGEYNDLYWDAKAGDVSDASLKGLKLNGSQIIRFNKSAIAGKLYVTYASRNAGNTTTAMVNNVAGTAVNGQTTETQEFTVEASATSVLLQRASGDEGVVTKIQWVPEGSVLQVTANEQKYVLSEANLNADGWFTTNVSGNRSNRTVDGNTVALIRTKNTSDKHFVNVTGAKAVKLDVVGGGNGRTYHVIINGEDNVFTMSGSEATSDILMLPEGISTITITGGGSDLYPAKLTFYTIAPSVITIKDNTTAVSSVTQYWNQNKTYTVATNNSGSDVTMSENTIPTDVATVTFDGTTLIVAPTSVNTKEGSGKITFTQAAAGDYAAGSNTLDVNVIWDSYTFTYSPSTVTIDLNDYDKSQNGNKETIGDIVMGQSSTTKAGVTIPAFPTLTVKKSSKEGDNVDVTSSVVTDAFLKSLNYTSDDHTLAVPETNGDDKTLIVKDGRQGIATITATLPAGNHINLAAAQYKIKVLDGYMHAFDDGAAIPLQQARYDVTDTKSSKKLLTLTLGGYKYGNWQTDSKGKAIGDTWDQTDKDGKVTHFGGQGVKTYGLKDGDNYIDGYSNQAQAALDSRNEKGKDNGNMVWFAAGEGGTTEAYQRIHPFSLPCRGAYIKFTPEVSGTATVYVLQNGNFNFEEGQDMGLDIRKDYASDDEKYDPLASGPRVYYWFDQDGWRIDPVDGVDPVAKQPLTTGIDDVRLDPHVSGAEINETNATNEWNTFTRNGAEQENGVGLRDYLTTGQRYNYGTKESPDMGPYLIDKAKIQANIDKGLNKVPQAVIPYHKGWMVMQKCYVKYVINVVAGKTYYFFSNGSKLGYAGINFKENANIKSDRITTITNTEETLALNQTSDDWSGTIASNKGKTIKSVTLSGRTFKADTWNTICLPFAVDEDQVQAIFGNGDLIPEEGGSITTDETKAKEVQLMVYNGYKNNTINFLRHVDQNILAGQPYLIRPAKTVENPTFTNVTIPANVAMVDYGSTDLYNSTSNNGYYVGTGNPSADPLQLIGTLAPTSVLSHDFYVNADDGHVYEMNGTVTINSYRSFLQQKDHSNPAKVTSVGFALIDDPEANVGGDTDGIMQILVDGGFDVTPVEGVYSVNGQKVSNSTVGLPKGVYIVNGKKIVVK